MAWKCTYCHTPLPAPPLPNTILWVCSPDGLDLEPACCDCHFDRGLHAWGRQMVDKHYQESHPQGARADEAWYLEWADGIPVRLPPERAATTSEADDGPE